MLSNNKIVNRLFIADAILTFGLVLTVIIILTSDSLGYEITSSNVISPFFNIWNYIMTLGIVIPYEIGKYFIYNKIIAKKIEIQFVEKTV